jgi:hypothetical protein
MSPYDLAMMKGILILELPLPLPSIIDIPFQQREEMICKILGGRSAAMTNRFESRFEAFEMSDERIEE